MSNAFLKFKSEVSRTADNFKFFFGRFGFTEIR